MPEPGKKDIIIRNIDKNFYQRVKSAAAKPENDITIRALIISLLESWLREQGGE